MDVVNPTYICPVCKHKREKLTPTEIICIHCKRRADHTAATYKLKRVKGRGPNKGKTFLRKVRIIPNTGFHPDDLKILTRMSRGSISVEKLYDLYFQKQLGRCKHCKATAAPLRVKLNSLKTSIKGIYCKDCLPKLTTVHSRIPTLSQELWRRADPLLRLMLASNPTFVECAEKESLCPPPKKDQSSLKASSNPSPSSQRLTQMELPYPPPSTTSPLGTTSPSITPKSQSWTPLQVCSKLPLLSTIAEIVPSSLRRWEQITLPLSTPQSLNSR